MGKIVVLKGVRLSYPKLFKADDYLGDGNFRYSATFLVPKDDMANLKPIDEAIKEATKNSKKPSSIKNVQK